MKDAKYEDIIRREKLLRALFDVNSRLFEKAVENGQLTLAQEYLELMEWDHAEYQKCLKELEELIKEKETKKMQLKDTVGMMLSDKHEDQVRAEIMQLYVRMYKLERILNDIKNNPCEGFQPIVPTEVLEMQHKIMQAYFHVLIHRAEFEGISLNL